MNEKTNKTILVIVVGLLCLSYIFKSEIFVHVSLLIGLLSLIHSKLGRFFEYLWMKFAKILGWINSRILLSLIFYLILLPVSLLYKLFSKSDHIRLKKNEQSYYLNRDHLFKPEDLEDVW